METTTRAAALLTALENRLRSEPRLLVAFSGGADSALVAAVAARVHGADSVATDEFERPEYVAHDGDRASACLSSRVAYGDPVTPELLGRIERCEAAVRGLGFPVCRVRAHAEGTVARLELPGDDVARASGLRREIDTALRAEGFQFGALDLRGFRSGRMNVLLGMPSATTR